MEGKNIIERFKNIDFLRFILAVMIVMFHYRGCLSIKIFSHCNVCVDFFFIIAGFFLFNNIKNENTFTFARKRFWRLVPMIWLLLLIIIIADIFIKETSFSFSNNILRALLLSNIGFAPSVGGTFQLGVLWFVPVLFWVSIFYFYIHKIFEKKYLNLIIWLIIIFSYTLYYTNNGFGTGGHSKTLYHFADIGVLRGLAGIGLGYFISMLYKTYFLKNCTTCIKWFITGCEVFLMSFLAYYLLFTTKLPGKSGFVYIVTFSMLFYLFLSKQGYISKFFEKDFWTALGNSSYAIYIMHFPMFRILHFTIYKHYSDFVSTHSILVFAIQTMLAILFGIFIHYIFEKPVGKYLKKKFL